MTHELFKEYLQETVTVIAIVGGAIAAYKAIHEMRMATQQRHQELRWKRAQAAKEVLHDIHSDHRASAAVTMLDWTDGSHDYEIGDGKRVLISYKDVKKAMTEDSAKCKDPRDIYIRDCFDWFLYHIDRVEHYIDTHYIDFIDVQTVFRAYALKLLKDLPVYELMIETRGYSGCVQFLNRYKSAAAQN
jgi:hypothetical protein